MGFQPTPSLRRATPPDRLAEGGASISTHALLAEGDERGLEVKAKAGISTHALLAEGDEPPDRSPDTGCISTHALLAEGD